jgi:hypothetical protein
MHSSSIVRRWAHDIWGPNAGPIARNRWQNFLAGAIALCPLLSLQACGRIFGTDKQGAHAYCETYAEYLRRWRYKRVRLLEIGIGGYGDEFSGGQSLRMWKAWLPFARICGMDISPKHPSVHEMARVSFVVGDQGDPACLRKVSEQYGPFDIIIDDGSHLNEHQITSLSTLFPLLKDPGLYVVEDTQTSYWLDYGGDPARKSEATLMHFTKRLADAVNAAEYTYPSDQRDPFEETLARVVYERNMVVLVKDSARKRQGRPGRPNAKMAAHLGR